MFDKAHQKYFTFGGLVFLNKDDRDNQIRKFIRAERVISPQYGIDYNATELKAARIKNKHKASLFRSTNGCIRYGFIIDQNTVMNEVFKTKKSKQRYLDFVYKVGIKRVLLSLIKKQQINPNDVDNIYVRFDEHTTATNGRYELREGLEAELKCGTFNGNYSIFYPPILPNMRGCVDLSFRDSRQDALIRASDIIANYAWHCALDGNIERARSKMHVEKFRY